MCTISFFFFFFYSMQSKHDGENAVEKTRIVRDDARPILRVKSVDIFHSPPTKTVREMTQFTCNYRDVTLFGCCRNDVSINI